MLSGKPPAQPASKHCSSTCPCMLARPYVTTGQAPRATVATPHHRATCIEHTRSRLTDTSVLGECRAHTWCWGMLSVHCQCTAHGHRLKRPGPTSSSACLSCIPSCSCCRTSALASMRAAWASWCVTHTACGAGRQTGSFMKKERNTMPLGVGNTMLLAR